MTHHLLRRSSALRDLESHVDYAYVRKQQVLKTILYRVAIHVHLQLSSQNMRVILGVEVHRKPHNQHSSSSQKRITPVE